LHQYHRCLGGEGTGDPKLGSPIDGGQRFLYRRCQSNSHDGCGCLD
jgi:hypothetical protein